MFEYGYENTQDSGEGSVGAVPYVDMSDPREMAIFNTVTQTDNSGLGATNPDSLYFGNDIYDSQANYNDVSVADNYSTFSQQNASQLQEVPVSRMIPSQDSVDQIARQFADNFKDARTPEDESRAVQKLFDQAAAANTNVHDMNRALNNALQAKDPTLSISTMSNAPDKISLNEDRTTSYSRETYTSDSSALHQAYADLVNMFSSAKAPEEIASEFASNMHTDMTHAQTQDVVQKAFDQMKANGLDSVDMVGKINQALAEAGSDVRVSAQSDKPDSFTIVTPDRHESSTERFQDQNRSNFRTSNDEVPNILPDYSPDDSSDELTPIDTSTLAQRIPTDEALNNDDMLLADTVDVANMELDFSNLAEQIPQFNFETDPSMFDSSLLADNYNFRDFSIPDLSNLQFDINFGSDFDFDFDFNYFADSWFDYNWGGGLGEEVYG